MRIRPGECRASEQNSISRLEDLGVSKTVRRDLLGHEPKDVTDDYTHSTIVMRRRAVSILCQTSSLNVLNFEAKSGRRLKRESEGNCKLLIRLVAGAGVEPATLGL